MAKKCCIHLYTGEGGGKTTAALGLAMRSLGHGHRVVVIQFMKGRKDVGEFKLQKKLRNYEVHQFGRPQFIDLRNPSVEDVALAHRGLEFAAKIAKQKKPDLLILDEINLAVACGLLAVNEVLDVLNSLPKIEVAMTGRFAPRELIEIADYASEISDIKHPYRQGVKARKGIEF
jgi:cob(I)alamin adenosyltransferase